MNFGLTQVPGLLATTAAAPAVLRVAAASPIRQRALVVLDESGAARELDPSQSLAHEGYAQAGPAVHQPLVATTGMSITAEADRPTDRMCTLANGSVAMVVLGNGTNATSGLTLELWRGGGRVVAPVSVTTDTIASAPSVAAIGPSGCVVCWLAGTTVKARVFDLSGAPTTAAISLSAPFGANGTPPILVGWSSGEWAVAYRQGATLSAYRFTAGGVALPTVSADTSLSDAVQLRALACRNGDLVLMWHLGSFPTTRIGRFAASGTQVGPTRTLSSASASLTSGTTSQCLLELASGRIAAALHVGTANTAHVFVVEAGFTAHSAGHNPIGGDTVVRNPVLVPHPFGFVYMRRSGGAFGSQDRLVSQVYDTTGVPIGPRVVSSAGLSSSYTASNTLRVLPLDANGANGYAVCVGASDNTSAAAVLVGLLEPDLITWRGFTVAVVHGNNSSQPQPCVALAAGNLLIQFETHVSGTQAVGTLVYRVLRRSILGIATQAVSAGQVCPVALSGHGDVVGGPIGTWDHRANTVPGIRGVASGQSVLLLGVA